MMTTPMMTAPRRRDKLVIMAEIMDISKDGALKTQIMFRANLSFSQLTQYLKLLTAINLLSKTTQDGKEVYRATSKGKDFLTRHEEIMSLLFSDRASSVDLRAPPLSLLRKA